MEYEADMLLPEHDKLALRHLVKPFAGYNYLAAGNVLKTCQHVQKRGFSAAAPADYAAELAWHYAQVNAPKRMYVHAANAVYLGDVPRLYYGLHRCLFRYGFQFISPLIYIAK